MSRDLRKYDLRRTLVANGFVRDRSATGKHRYVGEVQAAGRRVKIALVFPDLEFTKLPTATLFHPEKEAPNVVAHLFLSGELCFARNEDIVLDRYNVGGTVLQCLELARLGLERALTRKKNLEREIAAEFPQHWQGSPFYYDVPIGESRPATLFTIPRQHASDRLLLSTSNEVLKRFILDEHERQRIVGVPAFVLSSERELTFKSGFRQPSTLEDFLAWLETVCPGNRKTILTEMARPFPKAAAVFVHGPNGCVGISTGPTARAIRSAQRQTGLSNLLERMAATTTVDLYSGSRVDLQHTLTRNMNNQNALLRKRIALIGCGTIGSHLAKLLAQSGAGFDGGTLLLIDNQTLEPGNVGRHYLGYPSVGEAKAPAMKAELARLFPDANIHSVVADALGHLNGLRDYELVVDATGEEALSFAINDFFVRLRAEGRSPDFLRVALFGNGDAAQALLVDGFDFACLKCLRPNQEQRWHCDPLRPGTQSVVTAAACGEDVFVAYGVAAPATAAALALQMILDWNKAAPSPRLRTRRLNLSTTVEVKDRNPRRTENCLACAAVAKR